MKPSSKSSKLQTCILLKWMNINNEPFIINFAQQFSQTQKLIKILACSRISKYIVLFSKRNWISEFPYVIKEVNKKVLPVLF